MYCKYHVLKELNEMFLYEKAYLNDINNDEYIPYCKYVISCEYKPLNDDMIKKTHLHYELNNGGSVEFNKLLDKYNLEFVWDNSYVALVYEKDYE
jgi:hypothetical protein